MVTRLFLIVIFIILRSWTLKPRRQHYYLYTPYTIDLEYIFSFVL